MKQEVNNVADENFKSIQLCSEDPTGKGENLYIEEVYVSNLIQDVSL